MNDWSEEARALLVRRMLLPGMLLGLAIACAWFGGGGLSNLADERETAAATDMREVAALRERSTSLRGGARMVGEKLPEYRQLVEAGYVTPKNPAEVEAQVETLSRQFHLGKGSTIEIQPEEHYPLPGSKTLSLTVVSSPVNLRMSALLDTDIFAFVDAVREHMSGHTAIRELTISRTELGLDQATQALLNGPQRPELVRAQMLLDWSTLDAHAADADRPK